MASLTVRQLDERLKKLLRLRAAKSGRSVEDEVRTILRAAAEEAGEDILESFTPPGKTTAPRRAASAPAGAKRVLLIVGGGIAAYKSLDLIRRLKERGLAVRCILTKAAEQFVTPLSAGAILGERVFTDLFDAASEFDVGHIRLARETDLIVVAPATADLMAKMAGGLASDLATAVLLAAGTKILLAPAMNPHMWANNATQRNLAQLVADGVSLVGPNEGEMAEAGERGLGRMAEPLEIAAAVDNLLDGGKQPLKGNSLKGLRVLVTSGPTHEPIDPVRYIANRSSGKQGHAIAAAAAAAGADVTLVSGPVNLPDPPGVNVVHVEIGARYAASGRARAAGGRRDLRRRGRRLARRQCRHAQDQEKGRPGHAGILAYRKSRHTRKRRASQVAAPASGDRLCRRNRKRRRQRQGQACAQRLRLDIGQRRVAANRHHGRRPQHHPAGHGAGHRTLAAAIEGRCGQDADRAHRRGASAMSGAIDIRITRLPHGRDLPLPSYQSALAAGLDLLAALPADAPLTLAPGARALVPTGIAIALPEGCEAQVRPRSGLAVKHGLTVLNAPGTVDADYRGEIQVLLVNLGSEPVAIARGMRIAQLVIATVARAQLREVASLDETARGSGGFGSTGG